MLSRCLTRSSIHGPPRMDTFVAKLCYRWSTSVLVAFSFVVTCRLLLGDFFECSTTDQSLDRKYVNAKCYSDGTYTLLSHLVIQGSGKSPQNYRRFFSFYPWVNLLLLVHAFNFYLPHLLWRAYENGRSRASTDGLHGPHEVPDDRLERLAKYVIAVQGQHRLYLAIRVSIDAANFAVAFAQTLWLVKFFDVTGVPEFLPFDLETWSDFRQLYFPPSGFCDVSKLVPPRNTVSVRAMCEMPLNRLFMYLFLFLYAWYLLVTILTGLVLVLRIVLAVPRARILVSRMASPLVDRSTLLALCRCMTCSDWFFLMQLQLTMTDVAFAQLLDKMEKIIFRKDSRAVMNDESSLTEEKLKELQISTC